VDKAEWEAFLGKLSEFEKKYELLLDKIDELQNELEVEKKKGRVSIEKGSETSPVNATPSPQFQPQQARNNFLSRLETTLKAAKRTGTPIPQAPYAIQNVARCSHCGSSIVSASRFCQRCGFDFGRLLCSCGRELSGSEKFCDRCGRAL
jgi:RNA polymerase-binding transcription factor DksA